MRHAASEKRGANQHSGRIQPLHPPRPPKGGHLVLYLVMEDNGNKVVRYGPSFLNQLNYCQPDTFQAC
eukprot:10621242-Prorocentrum_lima.AAC.1